MLEMAIAMAPKKEAGLNLQKGETIETLPKAQRTRGLSSSFQINLLGHITSSNTNLDQTSSSKSQPSNYFKISTKHHYLN